MANIEVPFNLDHMLPSNSVNDATDIITSSPESFSNLFLGDTRPSMEALWQI